MRIENRTLLYKPPEVNPTQETNSPSKVSPQRDQVEISEEARSLLKSPPAEGTRGAASESRIALAKTRVAEDFYFQREVLSVVAEELLRQF